MTDFAKAVDDFETACYALGDRGILDVGSDHMPADLLKQHETAMTALMAFAPIQEAAEPSEEPVGYLFELCYSHEHDRWSGPMYSECLPKAEDVRNVRPLVFASPAVAPVASVMTKPLGWRANLLMNWVAPSIVGQYFVFKDAGNSTWAMAVPDAVAAGEFKTADLAKAAAQADFNARILSSIIPATKGGEDELRRAWEYGRASWCPAGIVKDKERTERDWREALAALSAQDLEAKS